MTTPAANATRLVTLAAALLVTAVEWTGFSEILLLIEPTRIASVPVTDASADGALPEVVVTAHQTQAPRS
jgi:hypothetical protein